MTGKEVLVARPLRLDVHWENGQVRSLRLSWSAENDRPDIWTETGRTLADALGRYVSGQEAQWPELPVDIEALPPFHRTVLRELKRVKHGRTVGYAELAERCGSPRAARAVGQAMAKNPWPLVYPCHRVLASGGKMGGYAFGVDMKKWLLELEGAL